MNRREMLFGRRARPHELQSLGGDERGATAVEYGLIGGIMAVALISSLPLVAKRNKQNYRCIKRAMKGRKQNRFCKKRNA